LYHFTIVTQARQKGLVTMYKSDYSSIPGDHLAHPSSCCIAHTI
jgi:hypothetical protein